MRIKLIWLICETETKKNLPSEHTGSYLGWLQQGISLVVYGTFF